MFACTSGIGCLRVDEMITENLLERHQRVVGLLLENAVAVARQGFVVVGGALLPQFTDPGAGNLLVVRDDLRGRA